MNQVMRDDDVAKLYCVWDEDALHIVHLYVPMLERGRGIGSCLLQTACMRAAEKGCCTVNVDDMTDRSHMTNNIYVRNGFRYVSPLHPEMVLRLCSDNPPSRPST